MDLETRPPAAGAEPPAGGRRDDIDQMIADWQRELPGIADVHFELTKRLACVQRLLADVAHRELSRLGHTYAEFEVLATLRRVGDPYMLKPGELSGTLKLSTGGTSNVLRRLSDAGLVWRCADQADARSNFVTLTPDGVVAAERAVKTVTASHRQLLRGVSEQTARAVADLLRDVTTQIETAS